MMKAFRMTAASVVLPKVGKKCPNAAHLIEIKTNTTHKERLQFPQLFITKV